MPHTPLDSVRSAVLSSFAGKPTSPDAEDQAAQPVITLSRQTGTDAHAVLRALVALLNERFPNSEHPWLGYDKALVDRVVEDHQISADLVDRFSERDRSWFEHFTAGLTGSATGAAVPIKTAKTIRGLATVGRCVIVGRGSQCILAEMANVIHVRLIAPLEWRAKRYAAMLDMDEAGIERVISDSDSDRAKFVKAHFGRDITDPELYSLVINVGKVGTDQAA